MKLASERPNQTEWHQVLRYNYRYAGKRKTLALGVYPDVSLVTARKSHQAARKTLANGLDPSEANPFIRPFMYWFQQLLYY